MRLAYHLIDPDRWAVAGSEYAPPTLADEGFVHLSFAEQVAGSADRHLPDAVALVALELDLDTLPADRVRVEDSYGSGSAYPHVYQPLRRAAVRRVIPLTRGADGGWRFSAGGGSVAASGSR